jgi:alkylated DNA repair dioxygenase AlkB
MNYHYGTSFLSNLDRNDIFLGNLSMDLFNQSEEINLLNEDGVVVYFGKIISLEQSNNYYNKLLHGIEWKNDEAYMFGKHIITKRKVAWYGDNEFEYTYSNITKRALLWTTELRELKQIVENHTQAKYNSCLLNLYHSGDEGMAWHSDEESDLVENASIASMTFGAKRKFSFKHKINKQKIDVELEHGSLLEMTGSTQKFWLHRLPPTKKVYTPRINLTFRLMVK